MYQFTVTATEFSLHTVVAFSLWELSDDGTRELERLESVFIPEPNGGLFEKTEAEFLHAVSLEYEKFAAKARDTRQ